MRDSLLIKIRSFCKRNVLLFLALLTFIYALFMPDIDNLGPNMLKLLTNQAYLVHDFFEISGLAATFFNVGLHFLLAYYLMKRNEISGLYGLQIAAVGIFVGHAFFGSNILNVLPIILGVTIYAKWAGHSLKLYTAISMFSCAMSPLVSYVIFVHGFNCLSLICGIAVGLVIGFCAPPLSEAFIRFHQGYTLFNFGFTTGMLAMLITSFFGYFNLEIKSVEYLSSIYHKELSYYILIVIAFILLFILLCKRPSLRKIRKLLKDTGRAPSDFITSYGSGNTLCNMCFTTSIYLFFILLLRFPLNGTLLGGLFTILGFSAFGIHPKNCFSVALGVIIAALLACENLASQRLLLTLLFSAGLAPIAGEFGWVAGLVAGFVHFNLTTVVINLHLGMSLYNNGFTSAFVAALIVPLAETLLPDRTNNI